MADKKIVRVRFNRFAPPYVTDDIASFPADKAAELVERELCEYYVAPGEKPRRGRPPKAASVPSAAEGD